MKRLLLAVLVLALGTACGSSSTSKAKGSSATPSTSSAPVAVTSSITSGQRLTAALAWTATPTTTAADPVQDIRFVVDGKVLWTERNSPYVFDDDGQVLAPWLLGNGPHELAVRLTTLGGKASRPPRRPPSPWRSTPPRTPPWPAPTSGR